ncbi:lytic murein transglycosylase [Bartonella tamiae]|uniref:Lytic murein transglycosylase n=1 Tax=Bartonella tamiae Th239 TaxID=1094558 RepID=J0R474_9HYPH|nr:lytic murein transglycosylase [Bartonella tamiae]EJF90419.1 lytic murein transglycosylase [Bartonella tamiae Th239]EJF93637.1 lytic murein transglycosylase [Bartonella tamiae Th307]
MVKILNQTSKINRRFALIGTVSLISVTPFFTSSQVFANNNFQNWVTNFKKIALKSGIKSATFDIAFQGVTSPDPEVLKKAAFQPEFTDPTWNYFDNRVHEAAIATGRAHGKKWAKWLNAIEKRFGVDRNILLAIWSLESNYGEILERKDVMRDAIRSLATLAYGDKRRAKFARTQLIAAMKILQAGDINRSHLTGSWAGALGHTQFIPTSYLAYAVDMDGDGKRDIWTSVPDALATAANLLKKNGWQTGRTWGYEVTIPANRKFPAGSLSIAQWVKLGIKRANGKPFPSSHDQATLKLPDGREGPIFLVIKNFSVIKRYNNADRYAFAVGLLADQIAGYPGLVHDWNRPFTPISIKERHEMQQRLKELGYYNGEIDGKIGSGSKKAIEAFQRRNGLTVDGHPSKDVLTHLRRG